MQKSLKHYFLAIKDKIRMIILFTLLFSIVGGVIGVYNKTKGTPDYIASVTILAGGPKAYIDEQGVNYERYERINKNSVNFLNSIINSEVVINKVIDNLKLNRSYEEFKTKIEAKIIDKTDMLNLKVRDKDPDVARRIIDEIMVVSIENFQKLNDIVAIEVLEDIRVEAIPMKMGIKTNMEIFGMIGCVISLIVILIQEYLDNTVKFPKDIEENLKLPVLSVIPNTDEASEVYRVLRTAIYNFKTSQKRQTILIASSDKNPSKSEVAANLAISMAKVQEKVLLIDGNIREPEIHTFFNLDNETGLSNILKYDLDYREAIQKVEEKNLDVLTSGPRFLNPAELLLTDKLEILFDELKKEYDFIIVNSYFLSHIPDAMAFSTIVDGIILVSTVGESDINRMKMAKKRLQELGANILGVTLHELS